MSRASEVKSTQPDTRHEDMIPDPIIIPTSPPPSAAAAPGSWKSRYLQETDKFISRLSSILSTPFGTDTILLTICYSSLLTSTTLTAISLARVRNTARLLIKKILTLPPETTIVLTTTAIPTSRLLKFSLRLKALSTLISDVRVFTRLWGLLAIWTWGRKAFIISPKEDRILRQVEQSQVVANICYQYLENYAYLSEKAVLGWSSEKQNKAWAWSSRFWALHVILDFARLWREKKLRQVKGKSKVDEESKWISEWKKQVLVNIAYTPLTIHWSLEKGLVNEFVVGLLGSVVGVVRLIQAWKKTLLEN